MSRESDPDLGNLEGIHAEAWGRFIAAYAEYGNGAAAETGLAGQWADLHRKVRKLRRAFWEGEESYLTRESEKDILHDLIGHCLLAIDLLERGETGGRK